MIPPLFGKQEVGIWRVKQRFPRYRVPIWSLWPNIRFLPSIVAQKMRRKMCLYKCMLNVYKNQQNRQTGSRNLMGPKTFPTIWGTYMKLVTEYQISAINSCDEKWAYMFNVHKNQQSRQTGSRNLMGPKTLPMIWGTYMKLVTKYQISAINSCWEKCYEKCAYMFNVYKNQQSQQTGSRNLMGPKTLPTIWYTYMTFVTKYQIPVINSYWEKCDEKYLGRTEGRTDGQTDRGKIVYHTPSPFGEREYD
jgi:hypothetical protein